MAGDASLAREYNDRLMPLHTELFLESNPIPVKWALHDMGKMSEGIRLPLTVLSKQYQAQLREAMKQVGIE